MALSNEAAIIQRWSKDIVSYIAETTGATPTQQQLKALLDFQEMVWAKIHCNTQGFTTSDRERSLSRKFGMSIMSGVGTGKGVFCSWVILWFMTCFPYPKIIVTSPSQKQLAVALWPELAKWHQRSKLKNWFTLAHEKFYHVEHGGHQWFCAQRTANTRNSPDEQAETLAGLHEDFLLIIGDEASGIPDPVFRPLESTLTRKCNLCLLTFNPTRSKGFAYETHNKDSKNWMPVHWNAEESDNVTKESIERYAEKYGRESNFFKIRVLGIPPTDSDGTVIPWSYIQDAVDREYQINPDDKIIGSLDVGAGGDDSALCFRQGPLVQPLEVASYSDPLLLTTHMVRPIIASECRALLIDHVGVGWGLSGLLRDRLKDHEIDIIDVNVGIQAFNPHKFERLRSELWWRLRGEFEQGLISIPNDPLLHGDLNGPRYEELAGKVKVETKKEMKTRGVDSPNRADSLMMTTLYQPQMVRQMYIPLHKRNKAKQRTRSWKTA